MIFRAHFDLYSTFSLCTKLQIFSTTCRRLLSLPLYTSTSPLSSNVHKRLFCQFWNVKTALALTLCLSLLAHNILSHNHTLPLSFSFWPALFIALLVLFVASPTGHTRGNSSSSVSNLPWLSNRTLEGGYPRATCGEAHQVSKRRRRPKSPFTPHSECNSICLFFLCTAEAYRISCIT